MKTILWATLTANGNYAQSGPENPPKKEALEDFTAHAKAAGIGRRSFEGMRGMVAVDAAEIPGVTVEIAPGSLILPAAKDTMPLSDLLNDCPIRIHDRTGSFLLPSVFGGFRIRQQFSNRLSCNIQLYA